MSVLPVPIPRFDLHQATKTRLEDHGGFQVYIGRPTEVPMKTDQSGIRKYVVLFSGAGRPDADGEDLAGEARNLDWPIQLIVAAATINDLLWTVDQVDALLLRWRPERLPPTVNTDGFVPPPGYDPGVPRLFDQVKPVRYELPLQYRLTATT